MGDEAEARLGFWVLGALVVAALIFVGVFFWATQARSAQPIRFSHQAHTRDMKCAACHQYVTQGAAAGTPSLADCMDCHEGTQSKSPEGQREEAKIQAYAKAKREIPWVRITSLAPDTFFSHRRHVAFGRVECATCHGDIAATVALPSRPLVALTMTRCTDCHRERKASLDCLACHR